MMHMKREERGREREVSMGYEEEGRNEGTGVRKTTSFLPVT